MAEARQPDQVILTINGTRYQGWTAFTVDMSLDNVAHAFSLEVTERWTGDDGRELRWALETGDAATVSVGGETLFSGWIDAVDPSLSAEDHSIRISGRAKTADLVDCAAIHNPGSWSGRKASAIAGDLCKPFGIKVSVEGDEGAAFAKFAIQPGESVFEAVSRMAKLCGLLVYSLDGETLILGHPKPQGVSLVIRQGHEAEVLEGHHSSADRFSDYHVKGQAAGNDEHHGKAVAQVKGSARDPAVKRHRPYLVIAEDQATGTSAKARAQWEATVRAAKSQGATITLPGLRGPDDSIIRPMRAATLAAPGIRVEGAMMVAAVSWNKDAERGTQTVLTLAYPAAYTPEPIEPEAKTGRIGKKKGTGR